MYKVLLTKWFTHGNMFKKCVGMFGPLICQYFVGYVIKFCKVHKRMHY